MKIPRDCDGPALIHALRRLGYEISRQTGSHIRITTQRGGEHHLSVPNHHPLKVGMLHSLLRAVAMHHGLSVEEVMRETSL